MTPDLEDGEVALTVLHTADWHLGKRFLGFSQADAQRLAQARLFAVERILALAERNAVHAVLCAGDQFDVPIPAPSCWEALAHTLANARGRRPLVLLPGNHDPLTEASPYHPSHPFRAALPDWVHVVDRDDFELPLGSDGVVYARPCRSQAGQEDPSLRLPARAAGDQRIRIGLVHGSTFDVPGYQGNFPIARDAAQQRGLDYLALGDFHGYREHPPPASPAVYPGTPEPTCFGEPDAGSVALVFFRRHGARPIVRRERVASWTWRSEFVESLAQLRELAETDLTRVVLRVITELRATPAELAEVERLLGELAGTADRAGRAGIVQVERAGLVLDTSAVERSFADLPPVIQAAARRLVELEASEPEGAGRALYHLYTLTRTVGARP